MREKRKNKFDDFSENNDCFGRITRRREQVLLCFIVKGGDWRRRMRKGRKR